MFKKNKIVISEIRNRLKLFPKYLFHQFIMNVGKDLMSY